MLIWNNGYVDVPNIDILNYTIFLKITLINTNLIRKVCILGSYKDLSGGYRFSKILFFA